MLVTVVLFLGALSLLEGGRRARARDLPRNRAVGIRTSATKASAGAWEAGHAAAGRLIALAGTCLLLGAILTLFTSASTDTWVALATVLAAVGVLYVAARRATTAAEGHERARRIRRDAARR